jgi:hypothetical protein
MSKDTGGASCAGRKQGILGVLDVGEFIYSRRIFHEDLPFLLVLTVYLAWSRDHLFSSNSKVSISIEKFISESQVFGL